MDGSSATSLSDVQNFAAQLDVRYSVAYDPDLKVAMQTAIQEMIDLLHDRRGLTSMQAYQLISVAGNVGSSQ